MKKVAVVLIALLLVVSVSGCFGPRKVTRSFDDWLNQEYHNQPWLVGNVISTALIGIAFWVTNVVDSFIDLYYFWAVDAWPFGSGTGTAFTHKAVVPKAK